MSDKTSWFGSYCDRLNSVEAIEEGRKHPCPCCRYYTLDSRGHFDICPVCFWEDDGQDDPHADEVWGGPNYGLSLTQARENFGKYGACDEQSVKHVRPPSEAERAIRESELIEARP